ncbi:hypothetical protein ACIPK9_37310 [Streptomyces sp. NPDC086771]|uniref:hypothetical protein n=1 Tax=unclassified Streptomyces TaxID=2593676 RepID=UPI0037FE53C2
MTYITAPWTTAQVDALNHYQNAGQMHPFTCGSLHADGRSPVLTATTDGWRCPNPACDYRQDWAHVFMAADAPTDRDQLLHLVDRSRRGVALPAELDQLAVGITTQAARVAELEAETTKLIRWHREDGTALDEMRATIERLRTRAEQADAVTAEVKRLMERRTTTLSRRAEQAEAALARVRAELHALASEVRGISPIALAGRRDAVARIRAALDEQPTT